MNYQRRFATDLEVKHFKEVIAPLRGCMNDFGGLEWIDTPELQRLAHEIAEELDRFGYVVNPIRLMVKVDASYFDPDLTPEQEADVMVDLEYIYRKLGI